MQVVINAYALTLSKYSR